MKRAFFVFRHGEAYYRERGFDLSPRGVRQMEEATRHVWTWYAGQNEPGAIRVFHSAARRAQQSAAIISKGLRDYYVVVSTKRVPALGPLKIRDEDAFWKRVPRELTGGFHRPEHYAIYWGHPIFDDLLVVAPTRSQIKRRSCLFLKRLLAGQGAFCNIIIAHFEVITSWFPLFGFTQELDCGEEVRFEHDSETDEVSALFRGVTRKIPRREVLKLLS